MLLNLFIYFKTISLFLLTAKEPSFGNQLNDWDLKVGFTKDPAGVVTPAVNFLGAISRPRSAPQNHFRYSLFEYPSPKSFVAIVEAMRSCFITWNFLPPVLHFACRILTIYNFILQDLDLTRRAILPAPHSNGAAIEFIHLLLLDFHHVYHRPVIESLNPLPSSADSNLKLFYPGNLVTS